MAKKIDTNTTTQTTGKTFIGNVVSDKMANTIVVAMDYKSRHPLYKKILKKRKKIYAETIYRLKLVIPSKLWNADLSVNSKGLPL